ncbi:MAG: hypothetical protein ACKOHH_10745 [Bacteroidota bacterium]
METVSIRDVQMVNEGELRLVNILVRDGRIWSITPTDRRPVADHQVEGHGAFLLPGLVDDQVHFREPGLTHKGCIRTESRAALRGGVTSFMEMPNTSPPTCNREAWEWKMGVGARDSAVNYSFYMGANGNNLEDLLEADYRQIPGVKIFMGSSTGELLVDQPEILRELYCKMHQHHPGVPIALHCENDKVIAKAAHDYALTMPKEQWTAADHPRIRNHEGCYASSRLARELAEACQADIHILHLTTAQEVADIKEYKGRTSIGIGKFRPITTEACVIICGLTKAITSVSAIASNGIRPSKVLRTGRPSSMPFAMDGSTWWPPTMPRIPMMKNPRCIMRLPAEVRCCNTVYS